MSDDYGYDEDGNYNDCDYESPGSSSFNPKDLRSMLLNIGSGIGVGSVLATFLRPLLDTFGRKLVPILFRWVRWHPRLAKLLYIPAILWVVSVYAAENFHKWRTWLLSRAMASGSISNGDRVLPNNVRR